ncbi:MAG: DUF2203 domain-containing protein [Conexivisphaerales archaeon]
MRNGYFTPEQVNRLIPKLVDRLSFLLQLKQRIIEQQGKLAEAQANSTLGAFCEEKRVLNKLVADFYAQVEEIEALGCIVKDVDQGLIDFPAIKFGEEVWLCWKSGEPRVLYWHTKDEGYNSRQPLLDDINTLV